MDILTYALLFAALLMISVGGVLAILYYDRRKQRKLEEKSDGNR